MFSSTEQGDYNITDYNPFVQLRIPENMTSQLLINFPPDNNALEGTEHLLLKIHGFAVASNFWLAKWSNAVEHTSSNSTVNV